jgi:hypothetical protein
MKENQVCPACNIRCPEDERGRCTHCGKKRSAPVEQVVKGR